MGCRWLRSARTVGSRLNSAPGHGAPAQSVEAMAAKALRKVPLLARVRVRVRVRVSVRVRARVRVKVRVRVRVRVRDGGPCGGQWRRVSTMPCPDTLCKGLDNGTASPSP